MIKFITAQLSFSDQTLIKIGNVDDVIQAITGSPVIGIDLETTGLDFISDKILLCAISTEEDQFIIDATTIDLQFLKIFLENPNILKLGHNLKFDYKFLRMIGIVMENLYDVMLGEIVLTTGKNLKYGLDRLVFDAFGIRLNKDVRRGFINHSGVFTLGEILYTGEDVEYLFDLYNNQQERLKKENLVQVAQLENHALPAIADIEFNGLHINQDKWKKQAKRAEIEKQAYVEKLDRIIMDNPIFKPFRIFAYNLNLFEPVESIRKVAINWNSPAQVLQVMKKIIPDLESVGAPELSKYKNKSELIELYIKYKEWGKLTSSYGEKFLEHLYADNRIHTEFWQILRTGRMSCSNPNMQQIPADNNYRNCFESGDPDWVFVSGDYKSQELAIIAQLSQDPVWLKALTEGKDLHSICAELVFGDEWKNAAEPNCAFYQTVDEDQILEDGTNIITQVPVKKQCKCKKHKNQRTQTKTISFGLSYGMSAHKLSERLNILLTAAESLMKRYFHSFPNIKAALERCASFGKKYGYVMTMAPWNRKRYFPNWRGRATEMKDLGEIERESKNSPIQGTGADQTKYALHLCRKKINAENLPVKLVMQVHDQIDTICHKDFATTWRDMLKELMEESARLTIPSGLLKADVNISNFWEK